MIGGLKKLESYDLMENSPLKTLPETIGDLNNFTELRLAMTSLGTKIVNCYDAGKLLPTIVERLRQRGCHIDVLDRSLFR